MKHLPPAVLLFACLLIHSASAETIIVRSDQWMPFNGDISNTPGYAIELLKEIFEPTGTVIDYAPLSFKRSHVAFKAGKVDCLIAVNKEEVPRGVYPEEEIYSAEDHIYTLAGSSFIFKNASSLKNIKLGIVADYDYGPELMTYFREIEYKTPWVQPTIAEAALKTNIQKLQNKEIDAFIETAPVLQYEFSKNPSLKNKIKDAGLAKPSTRLYITFTPAKLQRSRSQAKFFDEKIRELRRSGRLKELLHKYNLTDWR